MTRHAIDDARVHLFRALEAERSMAREHFLWKAADALDDAGFPGWATLAEAAAQRTGGSDRDMSDLLFDIDRECSRRDHTAPIAPPAIEQSTRFEGHRCVRCRNGEKACVRGNPNECEWREPERDD